MKTTAIAAALFLLMGCQDESFDGEHEAEAVETAVSAVPLRFESGEELVVYTFGSDVLPESTVTLVKLAVEHINAAMGTTVVAFEPGNYFAEAQIVDEIPGSETTIAWASRSPNGECVIFMGREASPVMTGSLHKTIDIPVAMHEMLHCLDIWHEEDPNSLMYPTRRRDYEQPMSEATKALLLEKRVK